MQIAEQDTCVPCSISVKDMLAGGLADESRNAPDLFDKLAAWAFAKLTAALRVTYTDVVFRTKASARGSEPRAFTPGES